MSTVGSGAQGEQTLQKLGYTGADPAGRTELRKGLAALGRAAGAVQRLLEVVPEVLQCFNPALARVFPCVGFQPPRSTAGRLCLAVPRPH